MPIDTTLTPLVRQAIARYTAWPAGDEAHLYGTDGTRLAICRDIATADFLADALNEEKEGTVASIPGSVADAADDLQQDCDLSTEDCRRLLFLVRDAVLAEGKARRDKRDVFQILQDKIADRDIVARAEKCDYRKRWE